MFVLTIFSCYFLVESIRKDKGRMIVIIGITISQNLEWGVT